MTAPVLSERELLILRRLAAGHPRRSIARDLDVCEGSITRVVTKMAHKFGAVDSYHMIALAYRSRVLRVPGCTCREGVKP